MGPLVMPRAPPNSFIATPKVKAHPNVAPQQKFEQPQALIKPTLIETRTIPSDSTWCKRGNTPKSIATEEKASLKKRLTVAIEDKLSSPKERKKDSNQKHALLRPLFSVTKKISSLEN